MQPIFQLASRRNVLQTLGGILAGAAIRPAIAQEPPRLLKIGQTTLNVQIPGEVFDLSQEDIKGWVATCARAVQAYLGEFPVRQARIEIYPSDRAHGVGGGRTWGGGGARSRVALGLHSTKEDLKRDWVLTHEMLHFTFPDMPRRHGWIEEGICTYAEPIARAKAGLIPAATVWADMIRDMPQGLPREGDEGLDNTHTWGRTYWGGAIFCLFADIRIRQATYNRKGLPDALRAINLAGGNITTEWPLERALETADHALGLNVLRDLHASMGTTPPGTPFSTDLPSLWSKLGVASNGSRVIFDDKAALASIRRAILADQ